SSRRRHTSFSRDWSSDVCSSDLYKDALGLSGAEGSAAARERFQTGPGYEFAMSQGLDALERRAAARGQLNSGGTSLDTLTFAHRSEERRVGKECISRGAREELKR